MGDKGCVDNGNGKDYGEGGTFLGKLIHNFIPLNIVNGKELCAAYVWVS